jgi:hypothetical protein
VDVARDCSCKGGQDLLWFLHHKVGSILALWTQHSQTFQRSIVAGSRSEVSVKSLIFPVLDEIPADKMVIVNAEHHSMDIVSAEVDQRERPFPAFSSRDNLPLLFTFSRPAGSELWEVETLQGKPNQDYTTGTQRIQLSAYGSLSFEKNVLLLGGCQQQECPRNRA